MSDPYIGEIRLFAGNFAPANWSFCDGSLIRIADNQALFAVIGTTYGGDGVTTFALPDFRGRVGINQGQGPGLSNYNLGQSAGTVDVTLTTASTPTHNHAFDTAGTSASTPTAGPSVSFANTTGQNVMYVKDGVSGASKASPAGNTVGKSGGSMPHDNLMPGLSVNYIISMYGIFPQS